MPDSAPAKTVLALQAFLGPEESEALRAIGMEALTIDGGECAFEHHAEPHMTISAWRTTKDEVARAVEQLTLANKIAPLILPCKSVKLTRDGIASWFLVPQDAAVPEVDAFRTRCMETLALDFEDFEGRSRTAWRPHITIFGAPETATLPLARLDAVTAVRLSTLALVEFDHGIFTRATVRLQS